MMDMDYPMLFAMKELKENKIQQDNEMLKKKQEENQRKK